MDGLSYAFKLRISFSMLFPFVVLRQTNIRVNLFSVNYCEKAVPRTCDKALAYFLMSEAYKMQNLTELERRRLSHAAKAKLSSGAYTNVLNKTNCALVCWLVKYALTCIVLEVIMSPDIFTITTNVNNLNQNRQKCN